MLCFLYRYPQTDRDDKELLFYECRDKFSIDDREEYEHDLENHRQELELLKNCTKGFTANRVLELSESSASVIQKRFRRSWGVNSEVNARNDKKLADVDLEGVIENDDAKRETKEEEKESDNVFVLIVNAAAGLGGFSWRMASKLLGRDDNTGIKDAIESADNLHMSRAAMLKPQPLP